MIRRGGIGLKRGPIKKVGDRTEQWLAFRAAKFERDKDDEGLVKCQDTMLGLPPCYTSRLDMHLHHMEGRSGKLLLDETKLVWLTKECHNKAHGN